jgi:hypothetical protein
MPNARGPAAPSSAPRSSRGAAESHRSSAALSLTEFKAKVLAAQIRNAVAKGRQYCADVPGNELDTIEGDHRMRREAAAQCRELLKAARNALADAKVARDALASVTSSIGVHSAYRSIDEDKRSWKTCFQQYYDETSKKREAAPGGAHGRRAVSIMVNMMVSYKAAPGYSNHSNGLAVDFKTTHAGVVLRSRKAQRDDWRSAWLHKWLVANAQKYRFHPLATEEWHWDFR